MVRRDGRELMVVDEGGVGGGGAKVDSRDGRAR